MNLRPGFALLLLAGMVSAGLHAASGPVDRALEALGGEGALAQLKTVAIRGSNTVYEIESSLTPGKGAESRPGSESKFFVQRDFGSNAARVDWERKVVPIHARLRGQIPEGPSSARRRAHGIIVGMRPPVAR